ncbi:hypothetical protein VDG1235_4011 [Verrucomicrobiia bacterium DG1235]|nr:hypothetical protein VDG1235_4011 [Verrucomicrobiae bacterium DG1235]
MTGKRGALGAIKGLLYMRVQELMTGPALFRAAAVFAASFGLLLLLRLDPDDAAEQFQGLVGSTFALVFLPIYCLTKGGETLRAELKDGTIEYLWVRPVSKVELYVGFFLSGLLGTLAIVGPSLLGISLAGMVLGIVDFTGLATLWLTAIAVVFSFSAVSGLFGSLSSKFVVLGILYYAFIELGLEQIPNGVQRVAITFHAEELLAGLTDSSGAASFSSYLWICGAGLVALGLGAAIFSQSRYVAGSEKES